MINEEAYPPQRANTGSPNIKLPTIPLIIPATACHPHIFSSDSRSINNNRINISSIYLQITISLQLRMRQQQSILQWASHILQERVSNLKAIQDVKFAKNLLWKIDDMYFTEWENGNGNQSYAQVLEMMGKYFKDEIGTDISQHIESLNVYRNVFEVWELALGIAIKGSNRGNNINLIFQMDRAMQAELVKIVANIIDKFGQAAANLEADQPAVEDGKDNQDRQMIVELLQENQELREVVRRLEMEFLKEQQDKMSLLQAKKQLELTVQSMRLEKMTFFEILSNANRSDSKIFEDNDGNALQVQPNLSQLAQDIVLLLGQQRKKINEQSQKNTYLEDEIRESRDNIRKCIDENQTYMSKLTSMNKFEKEIQNLRNEKNEIFQQNLGLLERIATLEDQIANLNIAINRRAIQSHEEQTSMEQYAQKYEDQKKKKAQDKKGQNKQSRDRESIDTQQRNSQDLSQSLINIPLQKLKSESVRRNMEDELKEPQLRNKLQREIKYLNTTINGLNRQVQALKKANQALQRSAKEFIDNNQLVVNKWQDDYQVLLTKMGALTKINEQLSSRKLIEQQRLQIVEQLAENIEEKKEDLNKSSSSSDVEAYQQNKLPPSIVIQAAEIKQKRIRQEEIKKTKDQKVALWDEIVCRLRAIVKEGKIKQLTYQNTIKDLKNQNNKLIELLRASKQSKQIKQNQPLLVQANRISIEKPINPSPSKSYFLNIQRVNSQQMGASSLVKAPPRLSIVDIQQGQQLDEDSIRDAQLKSRFFNVNSELIHDFDERASSVGDKSQDYYRHLDRKLSQSIHDGFGSLAGMSEDIGGSVELQKQMGEEMLRISKQYQKLNGNYQNVFKKLHLYTQGMKEKQALKQGYKQVLDEISKAENQIQTSHHSQILKLRLTNQHLSQRINQVILEKQQIIQTISKLSKNFLNMKQKQQQDKLQIIQEVGRVLTEVQLKYNDSMKNPLSFLDACLQGSKDDGQLQKFYRLYVKQREKTEKLNEELELLSSVLLEYRNMLYS